MAVKKSLIRNYAKLVAQVGANIQKNQDVVISANVNEAWFVEYVIDEAYKAGARHVSVEWGFDPLTRAQYKKESVKTLTDTPAWRIEKAKYESEILPAKIYIVSDDPDAMKGVDPKKISEVRRINGPKFKPFRDKMDNHFQWTIIGVPGDKWAKKVFPDLRVSEAKEKLFEAILKTSRAYDGDSVENWKAHNKDLKDRCSYLNSLGLKTLYYKASNGTDFKVSLKKETFFEGGSEDTIEGVTYQPNIPTEECFTSPDKYSAEGVVYASKSLTLNGKVLHDFGFKFEGGKVVEVLAKDSDVKEALEALISTDEGSNRLGEVALVPFDSPINQTGLLFYETLYDENACCHLALGMAFDEVIKGFDKMSEEEIKAVDLNDSIIHVDFMIGTQDLSIEADTYDGNHVNIFKNGTWAK